MTKKMENGIKNYKSKMFGLLMLAFLLGGAIFVTMYVSGSEVIKKNEQLFMVSHTEYRFSEMGQIVVRLIDYQGAPIAVTNCTTSILNPDKTFLIQDALMVSTGNITGDYYYNFTTPDGPEGIYEYQATCNYPPNKQKSATNSFHLSGAFNTIQANLTSVASSIADFRVEVAANFTSVLDALTAVGLDIAQINSTVNYIGGVVDGIDSNLNGFIANTTATLDSINSTIIQIGADVISVNDSVNNVYSALLDVNTSLSGQISDIQLVLQGNFSEILANLSGLSDLVNAVNLSLSSQLTTVNDNVLAINQSISTQIADLSTKVDAVNLSISTSISDFRQEVQVNFSQVLEGLASVGAVNYTGRFDQVDVMLSAINITAVSTYDYITGTLASNVNDVLTAIGVINATVNRIEQNTLDINSTVNTIKQNQEDEVYISTYSG